MTKPLVVATVVLALVGCSGRNDASGARHATHADSISLAKLAWIKGTWRGVGVEETTQEPFFERYSFKDDSTLLVESFKDSTLTAITDTTRYEQHGDSLTNPGPGPRWSALIITADSAVFLPIQKAKNQFVWRRDDDSTWTAVLDWPSDAGIPRHRVYRMSRVR